MKIRKRRRRTVRLLFIVCCVICFLCGFQFRGAKDSILRAASTESVSGEDRSVSREKYYRSIVIDRGDTLYSIAREYMSDEYDSVNEYIRELKQINGMVSNTLIQGKYLTIPYYEDDTRVKRS